MLSLLFALATPAADLRPVFHYRRTNGDGSEAEDIYVFAEAPGRIAVVKEKSRCTNAAYVTADIDPASGQATALTGGRLTRDLTQQAFAWLTTAEGGTKLQARIGSREAVPTYELTAAPSWRVYDFDFADMAAYPPKGVGARADFGFDLPLILSAGDGFSFSNRGRMTLAGATSTRHFGGPAVRYRASGAAGSGTLWFDARSGVLLEARLPLANHSEYRDFRLRLIRTSYGEVSWKAKLADHWRGCPPADG
ncbi:MULTISPECIES: hypothetical protein [unclassified Sphingopyxis]|uniref:hypothetical protein n=1 Tax=unclassified Sphingopyxis TaxID=2614943 RepID=UPI0007368D97|nr:MULTISPECIES: hypothetical protein [unclassified Sphingopyxis]KTE46395.1 hypothetical protein ATE62_00160 [Sphingopyxis sp. HIX]KTE84999.1 hypothetical protein ATE72_05765 [Sphingopyxis sp. HXXIV]